MTPNIVAPELPGHRHASLVAALAAFHAEAPKVIKDATAKVTGESKDGGKVSYSYGYADLATVTEALNPLLGKHGLAFTSKPTLTEQGFGLVYALKHESGESDGGFWPLPDPTRVKPQDLGSWITYWRRYAFLAVTNTFPNGEDDDGKQAQAAPRESWDNAKPRPTTEQAFDQHRRGVNHTDEPEPPKPTKTSWTDDEVIDYQAKLTQVDLAHVGAAYDWMAERNIHNRPTGASGKTATLVLALRIADTALLPEATPEEIADLKGIAEGRGLMKVKVSATETLEEALFTARELAVHAAVEQAKADIGTDLQVER